MRLPFTGRRTLLILLSASLLGGAVLMACASPTVQRFGPPVHTPRLAPDHARMADGYRLPVRRWEPENGSHSAVVLALHGFNEYSGSFSALGERLAQDGILTYAYDQRSFGATEGRGIWPGSEPLITDARTMLTLLRERHPDTPIYLLGMSMGGAVAIKAITHSPHPAVDGTLLVAPAVWARPTMPWYQRVALTIGTRLAPWHKVNGGGLDIQPSDNIEMLRAQSRDPNIIKDTRIDAVHGLGNLMDAALAAVPQLNGDTLILYGEKDQIIPHRPTCRMLDMLPRSDTPGWRFVLYPDGYHMLTRDLQQDVVHTDISAWIRNPDGAVPSGLETEAARAARHLCGAALSADA